MPFNYTDDVAPLKGQSFDVTGDPRVFERAMQYRQEHVLPMQQQTIKMNQQYIQMQNQQLAGDKLRMDLEMTRTKAKSDADIMTRMPEIMADLDDINGESDPDVARRRLDAYKIKTFPDFKGNAKVGEIFGMVGSSIANRASIDRKRKLEEEQTLKEDRAKHMRIGSTYASLGDVDTLTDLFTKDDDTIDAEEASLLAIADKAAGDSKLRLGQAQLEFTNERLDSEIKRAQDDFKAVSSIKTVVDEYDESIRTITPEDQDTLRSYYKAAVEARGAKISEAGLKAKKPFDLISELSNFYQAEFTRLHGLRYPQEPAQSVASISINK